MDLLETTMLAVCELFLKTLSMKLQGAGWPQIREHTDRPRPRHWGQKDWNLFC